MMIFIVLCSRYVLPFILSRIAHSAEFLFLFTLAWCFGITSVAKTLGFSMETGALMAGLALGSSAFQAEIMSRVKPLRDFFLILFFIILGSGMAVGSIGSVLVPAFIFSLFILVGNPLILYVLFRRMKFTRRNSFMAGLTAAQVSEFGFVLLFAGERLGIVAEKDLAFFTLVALTTIFVSSYLISYNEQIFSFFKPWFALFKKDHHLQTETEKPLYDIWVIGAHRIGWRICQALQHKKASFAVLDFNPETLATAQSAGMPTYFGDAADVEYLSELPLDKAKLVISTIPDPHDQLTFIKHVRAQSKKTYIVANLTHAKFRESLYAAGADYVMLPHVLGGELVADLIKKHSLTKKVFKDLRKEQEAEIALGFVV
jgi:voltage-gated potassium channel Kch